MLPRPRVDVLGSGVDLVDEKSALARVVGFLESVQPAHIVTFGAEMALYAQEHLEYREVVNAADLVLPDSVGIIWASRALRRPIRSRVAGIEFAERLCTLIGYPVYLLGAADGVAFEAAARLRLRHPNLAIAGTHHGYFGDADDDKIAEAIRASGARIVFVALGFPRQEFWIRKNLRALGPAVCMGVGGTFDVWAGRAERAPRSMRALGLEWLHRLISEPHRYRRQAALPVFAWKVFCQSVLRRPNG